MRLKAAPFPSYPYHLTPITQHLPPAEHARGLNSRDIIRIHIQVRPHQFPLLLFQAIMKIWLAAIAGTGAAFALYRFWPRSVSQLSRSWEGGRPWPGKYSW